MTSKLTHQTTDSGTHEKFPDFPVKCKAKTGSADLKAVTMKNGRAAAQATCVVCGARKFRIGAIPQQ